jgi:hypothetical protein
MKPVPCSDTHQTGTEMLQDKDAEKANRVMEGILNMVKLDIKLLEQAYEQRGPNPIGYLCLIYLEDDSLCTQSKSELEGSQMEVHLAQPPCGPTVALE